MSWHRWEPPHSPAGLEMPCLALEPHPVIMCAGPEGCARPSGPYGQLIKRSTPGHRQPICLTFARWSYTTGRFSSCFMWLPHHHRSRQASRSLGCSPQHECDVNSRHPDQDPEDMHAGQPDVKPAPILQVCTLPVMAAWNACLQVKSSAFLATSCASQAPQPARELPC